MSKSMVVLLAVALIIVAGIGYLQLAAWHRIAFGECPTIVPAKEDTNP